MSGANYPECFSKLNTEWNPDEYPETKCFGTLSACEENCEASDPAREQERGACTRRDSQDPFVRRVATKRRVRIERPRRSRRTGTIRRSFPRCRCTAERRCPKEVQGCGSISKPSRSPTGVDWTWEATHVASRIHRRRPDDRRVQGLIVSNLNVNGTTGSVPLTSPNVRISFAGKRLQCRPRWGEAIPDPVSMKDNFRTTVRHLLCRRVRVKREGDRGLHDEVLYDFARHCSANHDR